MIFYFSATGNSRWVAGQLAELTGDELFNMADFLREGRVPALPADTARVGVVFPIHSWYVPAPVLRFLSQLAVPASAYRYAVCTCGDDCGCTRHIFQEALYEKGWDLASGFSVTMPNTYVCLPGFDIDDPQTTQQKLKALPQRLTGIVHTLLKREHGFDD